MSIELEIWNACATKMLSIETEFLECQLCKMSTMTTTFQSSKCVIEFGVKSDRAVFFTLSFLRKHHSDDNSTSCACFFPFEGFPLRVSLGCAISIFQAKLFIEIVGSSNSGGEIDQSNNALCFIDSQNFFLIAAQVITKSPMARAD